MSVCKTCRKPKAPFNCGICEDTICKNCAQFVGAEKFNFLKVVPKELCHDTYCTNCYDDKVAGPLHDYEELMDKARDIIIYGKDQTTLTRFLKRKEIPYTVDNCIDRDEVVMRMAFFAAQEGFNTLIDVVVTSKKVDEGTYKKLVWSGSAVPITIDPTSIRGR